jgi:hypothetical protein
MAAPRHVVAHAAEPAFPPAFPPGTAIACMGTVLRISISSAPEGTRLMLEGQLIGPWVGELEQACSPLQSQGFPLVLDLAAVSFVGREGVDLLWELRDRGVILRNCSRLVDEQLKAKASHGH